MSFRGRLAIFFILIVILPMIALAIVLFSLTESSETGKADAGIAQGSRTAFAVHEAAARQTAAEARAVAADPRLRQALADGRTADARARIGELVGGEIEAIEIRSPQGLLVEPGRLRHRRGAAGRGGRA